MIVREPQLVTGSTDGGRLSCADKPAGLAGKAGFDLLDAGLERCYLLFQFGQVAREHLALTGFVCETRFDPAQGLHDRLVFLLQAFEPAVNFIEVTEHFAPQLSNLPVDAVKALIDLGELTAEELDQLLVFGRRHGVTIIPSGGPRQAYPSVDRPFAEPQPEYPQPGILSRK